MASFFYKNNAIIEKEKNFCDSFIRDILQGKIKSQIEAVNKAKAFGWNLEFPQILVIIRIVSDDEIQKKTIYEYMINSKYVEKLFASKLYINEDKIKTIYLDNSLVAFINSDFEKLVYDRCVDMGNNILKEFDEKVKIGIGFSDLVDNIGYFPNAYNSIHDNLISGSILNRGSFVIKFDDYGMLDIIKEVKDTAVLKTFVLRKLGGIIEHDRENSYSLLETLKVLIEENLNIKNTAEKLFLHYNTVRYRIAKIKDIGVNFDNGFKISEVVLAYKIYIWLLANDEF